MKKICLIFSGLLILGTIVAQTPKLRVGIAFDTDTTFTVMGPLSTKMLDINLIPDLYQQIKPLLDTSSFQLKQVSFPSEMSSCNESTKTGLPEKYLMHNWLQQVKKKEGFDLVLVVFKPVQMTGKYAALEGFSYGVSVSKRVAFSLNNAIVYELKSFKALTVTRVEHETDYIAGTFNPETDMVNGKMVNPEPAIQQIRNLNQSFAMSMAQCILAAKQKMEK